MAGRVRVGPGRVMWENFKNSIFRNRDQRVFVGEDYLGNRYFEKHNTDARSRRAATIRSFELKDKSEWGEWEKMPPEWEAWLRLKRDNPPTAEEIKENIRMMHQKQHNAKLLEEKRRAEEGEPALPPPADPNAHRSFPTYSEYSDGSYDPKGSPAAPIRDHTIR